MNDKEYSKRYDKWTETLNKKQHYEFLQLENKRGEMLSDCIKEAKKEVFDDIEELLFDEKISERCTDDIEKLKKKHLQPK